MKMNVGGGESLKLMWKQCSIDPSWQYKKEGIFEIFPAGLRVLVVDDDRVCLVILEKMLKACLYEGIYMYICIHVSSSISGICITNVVNWGLTGIF